MVSLSVVLISRNQAWNVSRLIESVLERTDWVDAREIILVDSASSDTTAQIACEYNIDVLQLDERQRLSAAAGRFVGTSNGRHEYILFLDGDMELCESGLRRMVHVLDDKPEAAAICGRIVDRPLPATPEERSSFKTPQGEQSIVRVKSMRGATLIRRAALEAVGGFDPYLYSDEEPELAIRLRQAGYELWSIDDALAWHYTAPSREISTVIGRWQRNLYCGAGQILRRHLGTSLFWTCVRERGYGLVPAALAALGVATAAYSIITFTAHWFLAWLLGVAALVFALALRRRSLKAAVRKILQRLFILDGTIRGFLMPLPPRDAYPTRVRVLRRVSAARHASVSDGARTTQSSSYDCEQPASTRL